MILSLLFSVLSSPAKQPLLKSEVFALFSRTLCVQSGVCHSRPSGGVCPGRAWALSVLPEFQRRGIASALIQEMFRLRDEAGIPLATILVDPENETAYSLYTKNGFSKNGQVTVFNTTYDRLER